MPADKLSITLVQPDIVWEQKKANLAHYESTIASLTEHTHVLVLPEMFSTGFSMNSSALAETMDGESVAWMKHWAAQRKCIITGSLIIEEEGQYYNRMLWVQPDGRLFHYDKRHLFGLAHENQHYAAGNKRLIVQVNGWRILLLVCYDLRFPVWARNQEDEYDVMICVANWPAVRSLAWNTLLQARAIENQAYVIGVNRVGTDGKGHYYSGDSSVYDPSGTLLFRQSDTACCKTVQLSKETVRATRESLPFLKDADRFLIM